MLAVLQAVPTYIRCLEKLPVNANGKVGRWGPPPAGSCCFGFEHDGALRETISGR